MTPSPSKLVLATRGSRLALRQAGIVSELLRGAHPTLEVEVNVVETRGDRDQRAFSAIGGKGLFTSEVETAVVRGDADVAVHSAKDLTAELAEGCAIVCVPRRAAREDVVVGGTGSTGEDRLGALPEGARVGTSSMRRRALLAEGRPDLEVVEFRGNIDTRLAKVERGEVDAAILARAGIERLAGEASDDAPAGSATGAPLDPGWWLPAPGQGALALEALTARTDVAELLAPVEDPVARAELECERAFATRLEGGCSVPLGCSANADGTRLVVTGFLAGPEGSQAIRDRISGGVHEAAALGRELAEAILTCGGGDLLEELRETAAPPVPEP